METPPLYRLKEIASILRSPNGCAWDKAQTSDTLKPYLIEEAYEVYQAIENNNYENLKEELGDLLYQIYAHAQLASEQNIFDIDDVATTVIEKLIRRHPHVFGNDTVKDKYEVIDRWEKIKKKEKQNGESLLEGVPAHLPALLKAYRVQQKVGRVGFDWERIEDVISKLHEEVSEFNHALQNNKENRQALKEEIGDILFTIVNIARHVEINPEEALQHTVSKFIQRFQYIEKRLDEMNKDITQTSLHELDALWEESKNK
ncbi:MAG: nucleoside triphosphate pyrophosphohydrolase [Spirochaetes bacterium]|nr:nucleoside triphosphate pyrophosphohydrolase [Spirochaetota bacterium]